jgi:integrase/recombinase XerD
MNTGKIKNPDNHTISRVLIRLDRRFVGMPNRFYVIDRPRKEVKLPQVLSKEDVLSILDHTNNIKHRCIVGLLYSAGLRRNELVNLKISDIDSKRMLIRVESGKGNID